MPTITVLDETTINKIAAGEVIERPASVVKELLENAIDAQATAVTVEIRDGGCSLIRITDNGCGIPKDQVATAFLRHATSKIHTVDDLMTIGSLGFRQYCCSFTGRADLKNSPDSYWYPLPDRRRERKKLRGDWCS